MTSPNATTEFDIPIWTVAVNYYMQTGRLFPLLDAWTRITSAGTVELSLPQLGWIEIDSDEELRTNLTRKHNVAAFLLRDLSPAANNDAFTAIIGTSPARDAAIDAALTNLTETFINEVGQDQAAQLAFRMYENGDPVTDEQLTRRVLENASREASLFKPGLLR